MAKIQMVKGSRGEIFSRLLRKNITHPLTVWIVGTDIERKFVKQLVFGGMTMFDERLYDTPGFCRHGLCPRGFGASKNM